VTVVLFIIMLTCAMLVPSLIVLVPMVWHELPEDAKREFLK
jgi:hypothetical protein